MKKLRMLSLALIAFAIVGVLSSCQFALNAEQEKVYDSFIDLLVKQQKVAQGLNKNVGAAWITAQVDVYNNGPAKLQGFKIIDTNSGTDLSPHDSKATLKLRFTVSKL